MLNLFKSQLVPLGDTTGAGSPDRRGGRGAASRRGGDDDRNAAPVVHRNNRNDIKKYKVLARNARFDLTRFESRLREVTDLLVGSVLSRIAFPAMGEDVDANKQGGEEDEYDRRRDRDEGQNDNLQR